MRTEQQVYDQILTFARNNEQIRAVTMNGSRVNPNAPKDFFCDFDVVYFVPNPRIFLEDQSWISYFGDLIILQQNDFEENGSKGYIFLMLFSDGVRIDLSFDELSRLAFLHEDSLTAVLLDKDGRIPALPPPSDRDYLVTRPTLKEFAEAVNEIFWCSNNVAKGIWRDELPYVKSMYDVVIRVCIVKMLEWYAAMQHDWTIATGYFGKWLKKYLPADVWEAYTRTYSGPGYEETWDSVFEGLALTRKIGLELADHLGYPYPLDDNRRVVEYMARVRALPKDALSYDSE